MATKRDYYEVLGVPRTSTPDEMKKAFRKLAMQFHPDKNPGDKKAEEKFKEVSEAYETLSDPQKRQMFDQFGHAGSQAGGFPTWCGRSVRRPFQWRCGRRWWPIRGLWRCGRRRGRARKHARHLRRYFQRLLLGSRRRRSPRTEWRRRRTFASPRKSRRRSSLHVEHFV